MEPTPSSNSSALTKESLIRDLKTHIDSGMDKEPVTLLAVFYNVYDQSEQHQETIDALSALKEHSDTNRVLAPRYNRICAEFLRKLTPEIFENNHSALIQSLLEHAPILLNKALNEDRPPSSEEKGVRKSLLYYAIDYDNADLLELLLTTKGLQKKLANTPLECSPAYLAGLIGISNDNALPLITNATDNSNSIDDSLSSDFGKGVAKHNKIKSAIEKVYRSIYAIERHATKFDEGTPARDSADTLVNSLKTRLKFYDEHHLYSRPGATKEFLKSAKKEIKKAYKELSQHRGWKGVIGNLLLALTGIGLLAIGVKAAHSYYNEGYVRLFFKTDSAAIVDEIDENLNRIPEEIASPAA